MAKIFIGTSGYNYKHWRGVFYPENLAQSKWLEYYCKFFDTVELNVTFYRLPPESAFKSWYKRTPKDFKFVVKGSRFITHLKRLKDCRESLKLLIDRIKHLKEKNALILWQLPPRFQAEPKRLEKFCQDLILVTKSLSPTPHFVFEFRDRSWFCEEIYKILKKYNCALCYADYPFLLVASEQRVANNKQQINRKSQITNRQFKIIKIPETADFIYIRRHGATALYASNYSDKQLKEDAKQIKKWLKSGKTVYIYFNNDAYGYAVKNALYLKKLLKAKDKNAD